MSAHKILNSTPSCKKITGRLKLKRKFVSGDQEGRTWLQVHVTCYSGIDCDVKPTWSLSESDLLVLSLLLLSLPLDLLVCVRFLASEVLASPAGHSDLKEFGPWILADPRFWCYARLANSCKMSNLKLSSLQRLSCVLNRGRHVSFCILGALGLTTSWISISGLMWIRTAPGLSIFPAYKEIDLDS